MTGALALLRRDVALALRTGGGGLMGLGFFLLVTTLLPLGIGQEAETLAKVAGGLLWTAALLACLLSLDRLFQADWEDGSLDQIMLSPLPVEASVAAKAAAHWLTTGLPLIAAAPVLAITLNLPGSAYPALMLSLLAGTPGLSLIGAVGAALTVGVRRGGLLLSLLVLPLYIPTLVFGAQAVERASVGLDPSAALMLTGAVTLLSAGVGPFAAAVALRGNLRGERRRRAAPAHMPTPPPSLRGGASGGGVDMWTAGEGGAGGPARLARGAAHGISPPDG